MENIKDTLKNVMQALERKRGKSSVLDIRALLKKALTKKEIGHIKINYFKAGKLYLNVDSSAWLYQFNLKKNALLARLNKKSNTFKDIYLRLGNIK